MENSVLKKLSIIIFPILGSLFLLSALGKFLDISNFQENIIQYGFPKIVAFIIIIIEFIIAFCFIFLLLIKKILKISLIFVLILSAFFVYGHFILHISSCGCFGIFDILNPSSFLGFAIKNTTLILALIFGKYASQFIPKQKKWVPRLLMLITSIILVIFSYQLNNSHLKKYAYKTIGKHVKELQLNEKNINQYNRLFFFSPSCNHCKKILPDIISQNQKDSIKTLGITLESQSSYLEELKISIPINFKVLKLEDKKFLNITKTIPIVFAVKNDTVQNVLLD